jgi:hypothetical protein
MAGGASADIVGKVASTSASYAKDSPYRALAGVLVEVDPYQLNGAVTHGSVENAVGASVLAQARQYHHRLLPY